MLKTFIKSIVPEWLLGLWKKWQARRDVIEWKRRGRPVPVPHRIKQLAIQSYQAKSGSKILVETGTYLGDMIHAQLQRFQKIISIELSNDLWKHAVKRFEKFPHVKIIQGDSGKVLHNIMTEINEPSIFWLDGHYSGGVTAKGEKECPVFEELEAILKSSLPHILLIDDARCFVGANSYPTLEELSAFLLARMPKSKIEVLDDIIRIELQ